MSKRILIQGFTAEGKKFRPSNWAERITGNLSTFKNHRIRYSPLLRPIIKDGYQCILLDARLNDTNPDLYQSVLDFAKRHNLNVSDEEATS